MSEEPILLEPRHMSNFPAQGINDRESRADHLFVVQVFNKSEGSLPGVLEFASQLDGRRVTAHGGMIGLGLVSLK